MTISGTTFAWGPTGKNVRIRNVDSRHINPSTRLPLRRDLPSRQWVDDLRRERVITGEAGNEVLHITPLREKIGIGAPQAGQLLVTPRTSRTYDPGYSWARGGGPGSVYIGEDFSPRPGESADRLTVLGAIIGRLVDPNADGVFASKYPARHLHTVLRALQALEAGNIGLFNRAVSHLRPRPMVDISGLVHSWEGHTSYEGADLAHVDASYSTLPSNMQSVVAMESCFRGADFRGVEQFDGMNLHGAELERARFRVDGKDMFFDNTTKDTVIRFLRQRGVRI